MPRLWIALAFAFCISASAATLYNFTSFDGRDLVSGDATRSNGVGGSSAGDDLVGTAGYVDSGATRCI